MKSKDLGRPLQEDISLEPGKGIKDFGIHDLGIDQRDNPRGRTAIDLVMEWGNKDFDAAFEWLAKEVGYVAAPTVHSPTPLDLWGHYEPPAFPLGLLPDVIERYAVTMGDLMGADPAGLAMAAIAVCRWMPFGFAVSGRLPLKVDGGLDISRDRVPLTGRTAVARGGGEVRVANRRDVA